MICQRQSARKREALKGQQPRKIVLKKPRKGSDMSDMGRAHVVGCGVVCEIEGHQRLKCRILVWDCLQDPRPVVHRLASGAEDMNQRTSRQEINPQDERMTPHCRKYHVGGCDWGG